jgi:hypothetical protein
MRFFQRLAPSARTQHAVQPVLPPRPAGLVGDRQEAGAAMPAQPARAPSVPAAPAPRPQPAARDVPVPVPVPVQSTLSPTRAEAVEIKAHPGDAAPPAPDTPASVYPAPVPPVLPVHRPAPVPAPDTAPHSRQQRDHAPAPLAPQRPLSAVALAQRMPAKSDTTIVHVTIDRIDVRAPAPVPAPAPRAQGKPRPATTSLADYLRRGRP